MPQTVPNKPIKGAVEPTVAKKVNPLSILVICFSIFYTPIVLFLLLIEKGVRIEVRLPVVGDIITMIIQIE